MRIGLSVGANDRVEMTNSFGDEIVFVLHRSDCKLPSKLGHEQFPQEMQLLQFSSAVRTVSERARRDNERLTWERRELFQ